MTRRRFLPSLAGAGVLTTAAAAAPAPDDEPVQRKGRLKQSVTAGVFPRGRSLEDNARDAARLGAKGFDLIGPADWPVLKKYGLIPTMVPDFGGTIPNALNRKEDHPRIDKLMREGIELCAKAGAPNLITFSGNRRGMPDDEGMENCALFLNNIKAHAEDKGVTICLELLNSKVNHKDYMCDHATWGVELMKRVDSPRVKLLYDIYHMQIMDGDIVRTIRANIRYIGHFHTGGNPGRHEIDDTQELNYHFVAQAIAALGFEGYIAHEYSPAPGRDFMKSLDQAISLCDV
jgi:hydroxypyruvate isomerase